MSELNLNKTSSKASGNFDTSMLKTALIGSSSSSKLDSYPVLKMIKFAFTVFSLVLLVFGGLISLYMLFTGEFLKFLVSLILTFFLWGTVKIQAELIQLVVDIADNTRRSADALERNQHSI